jgi:hypothetical protein
VEAENLQKVGYLSFDDVFFIFLPIFPGAVSAFIFTAIPSFQMVSLSKNKIPLLI